MSVNREVLRRKAKKVYKEKTKNMPKHQRPSFAQFFKQYKKSPDADLAPVVEVPDTDINNEDFDFENLINVNTIDDDSLEVEEEDESETVEE